MLQKKCIRFKTSYLKISEKTCELLFKKSDFVSGQYKLSVVTWPVSSSIMQYLIAYMSIHQHATGIVQSLPR